MKSTYIFLFIAMAAIVGLIVYAFQGEASPEEYAATLQAERVEKDAFMKNDKDSPFHSATETFTGLRYYPPDLRYRIKATVVPIDDKKIVALPTSDGLEKKYLEYATVEFTLDDVLNRLVVLEIVDDGPYRGTLFLAFADETSARDTYGAGRYLELKKIGGAATMLLDFNKCYNPYCAYSDKFSCPFPPKGNVLTVPIKAGEKTYRDSH